jgi:hypothetical protein
LWIGQYPEEGSWRSSMIRKESEHEKGLASEEALEAATID